MDLRISALGTNFGGTWPAASLSLIAEETARTGLGKGAPPALQVEAVGPNKALRWILASMQRDDQFELNQIKPLFVELTTKRQTPCLCTSICHKQWPFVEIFPSHSRRCNEPPSEGNLNDPTEGPSLSCLPLFTPAYAFALEAVASALMS
jgi:hypothetical protein